MTWRTQGYERAFCRACGERGERHRGSDGHCPGRGRDPRWPSSVKDEQRAGAIFDARMLRFWQERATHWVAP